mmetsp:Transcript_6756/g.28885  ORF Transcript_6756/g.28885 Transcript_6756/m.28885 type:complete len:214 (+) Transcript_6756:6210-6851(+)
MLQKQIAAVIAQSFLEFDRIENVPLQAILLRLCIADFVEFAVAKINAKNATPSPGTSLFACICSCILSRVFESADSIAARISAAVTANSLSEVFFIRCRTLDKAFETILGSKSPVDTRAPVTTAVAAGPTRSLSSSCFCVSRPWTTSIMFNSESDEMIFESCRSRVRVLLLIGPGSPLSLSAHSITAAARSFTPVWSALLSLPFGISFKPCWA